MCSLQLHTLRADLFLLETHQRDLEGQYHHFAREQGMSEQEANAHIEKARSGLNRRKQRLQARSNAKAQEQMLESIAMGNRAILATRAAIENTTAKLERDLKAELDNVAKMVKSLGPATEAAVDICKSRAADLLCTLHDVIAGGLEESSPLVAKAREVISATQVRKHPKYIPS